jgi:quinol monooxygenase YgiN
MRSGLSFLCAVLMLALGTMLEAQAQDTGTVYVVTYLEVRPTARAEATTLLKELREQSRKQDGNLATEVLVSSLRPGQFVVLTTWKDQKALDAHMAASAIKDLRGKVHELRNSPADDRIHNSLTVAKADAAAARRPIYVVTHVDVPPPRKDDCIALLRTLADASRKEAGNLRYDVVQQTSRPNHFTVVEVWRNRKAFDEHAAASAARAFRDQLTPMSGALYDERLYRGVDAIGPLAGRAGKGERQD